MTSRQAKIQEDTHFRIMRILQDNPDLTQRELADKLGMSVGGLNYCLNPESVTSIPPGPQCM
jgi:DNA-binding MarR family transcriptional regulator